MGKIYSSDISYIILTKSDRRLFNNRAEQHCKLLGLWRRSWRSIRDYKFGRDMYRSLQYSLANVTEFYYDGASTKVMVIIIITIWSSFFFNYPFFLFFLALLCATAQHTRLQSQASVRHPSIRSVFFSEIVNFWENYLSTTSPDHCLLLFFWFSYFKFLIFYYFLFVFLFFNMGHIGEFF